MVRNAVSSVIDMCWHTDRWFVMQFIYQDIKSTRRIRCSSQCLCRLFCAFAVLEQRCRYTVAVQSRIFAFIFNSRKVSQCLQCAYAPQHCVSTAKSLWYGENFERGEKCCSAVALPSLGKAEPLFCVLKLFVDYHRHHVLNLITIIPHHKSSSTSIYSTIRDEAFLAFNNFLSLEDYLPHSISKLWDLVRSFVITGR